MKRRRKLAIVLHMFIGIGAIAGGLAAVINPQSPLGISTEMLRNSPFENYFIPGIFLLSVIGIGNIFAAIAWLVNLNHQGYITCSMGSVLIAWILIQCYMLWTIAALHVLFFGFGVLQLWIGILVLLEKGQFPFKQLNVKWNKRG